MSNSTTSPTMDKELILSLSPALLGGYPTRTLDLPLSAVLISIFATLAATNVTLFIRNKRRGIFFPLNMVTFGFCMARITTFVMRIVWSTDVLNKDVAMVAQIFVAAGVVLLYILNLILAKRLLDSRHPVVGRNRVVRGVFKLYYISLVVVLALVISSVVRRFSGKELRKMDTTLLKFGPIWFSVFSFIPIPLSIITALVPAKHDVRPLGTSADRASLWEKVAVIVGGGFFLCLGSSLRAGLNFLPQRLNGDPAWYHSKGIFYVFLPVVEICAVLIFVGGRMDRKFFVGVQAGKEDDVESVERGEMEMGEKEKEMGVVSGESSSSESA